MPQVRANVGAKWVRRAASAAQDYAEGVQQPRVSWQAAATAARQAYEAGIQQAITEGRWTKGIQRAGDQTWQQGAVELGTQRYGPGVAAAQSAYEQAVAPYLQAIAATQLPPRGPKGDPKNLERVRVLNVALRKVKTGGR